MSRLPKHIQPLLAQPNKREKREHAILKFLAEKGPMNKYGICKGVMKQLRESEPTLIYAVDNLREQDYIIMDHEAPGTRGKDGKSKYYDLTERGVMRLVQLTCWVEGYDRLQGPVRKIAEKYPGKIPTILPLWPELLKAGLEVPSVFDLMKLCGYWADPRAPLAALSDESHHDASVRYSADYLIDRIVHEPMDWVFWLNRLKPSKNTADPNAQWLIRIKKNPILLEKVAQLAIARSKRDLDRIDQVLRLIGFKDHVEIVAQLQAMLNTAKIPESLKN